jgi:hypothetical protein
LTGGNGEPVGDEPECGRVDAEAEVPAADLDVLVQATMPSWRE